MTATKLMLLCVATGWVLGFVCTSSVSEIFSRPSSINSSSTGSTTSLGHTAAGGDAQSFAATTSSSERAELLVEAVFSRLESGSSDHTAAGTNSLLRLAAVESSLPSSPAASSATDGSLRYRQLTPASPSALSSSSSSPSSSSLTETVSVAAASTTKVASRRWGAVFVSKKRVASGTHQRRSHFWQQERQPSRRQRNEAEISSMSQEVLNNDTPLPVTNVRPHERLGIVLPPHHLRHGGITSDLELLDPMAYKKPLVFLDLEIDGQRAGQLIFELFTKQAPNVAENFRLLFTGERGVVPNEADRVGAGLPLHLKGNEIYRVVKDFCCQAGAGTESAFGGFIKDDPAGLLLKHDKKGVISAVSDGPDTISSHFAITFNPAPHMDGVYVVFGQLVGGMDLLDRINTLGPDPSDEEQAPTVPIDIIDSGELDCDENLVCKKMEKRITRVLSANFDTFDP